MGGSGTSGSSGATIQGLTRANLAARSVEVLSYGGPANPDVHLVRGEGESLMVVKDFAPRAALLRETFGRWSIRREARAYRILEGAPGVPRLLGLLDPLALVLEYRPGVLLSRSLQGCLPGGFLDELKEAVECMHARGVVHLDLRHRSNVLAGEDGHPVLIDFASAICMRPGGLPARTLLAMLARIDQGAVRKWEAKLRVGEPPPFRRP